jgi:hypothetical protein
MGHDNAQTGQTGKESWRGIKYEKQKEEKQARKW